jgi:hypothetical protein
MMTGIGGKLTHKVTDWVVEVTAKLCVLDLYPGAEVVKEYVMKPLVGVQE